MAKKLDPWRQTLHLPHTLFPVRAPFQGPSSGPYYEAPTDPLQVLLDGPPFANGPLHIGHALNHFLKDFCVRSQTTLLGRPMRWAPGWDCHGLPIELKALRERQWEQSDPKSLEGMLHVRQLCRQFAQESVDRQRATLQSWHLALDHGRMYTTMDPKYEARELRVLGRLVRRRRIYQGRQPVLWSPSSKTALADAEVEYRQMTTLSAFVKFPLLPANQPQHPHSLSDSNGQEDGEFLVAWTSTPWTLLGNQGLAINPRLTYHRLLHDGVWLYMARTSDTECFFQQASVVEPISSDFLLSRHYQGLWDDASRPVWHGDFVTADQGTGVVHLAPGHGPEDHALFLSAPIADDGDREPIIDLIDENGCYHACRLAELDGQSVFHGETNRRVLHSLRHGGVLAVRELEHSVPVDWRTQQPVVYRRTPQWYLRMPSESDVDQALDRISFVPRAGREQLSHAISQRPRDWCISRQRVWGVPIPAFHCPGEPSQAFSLEASVIDRFANVVEAHPRGTDAWWLPNLNEVLNVPPDWQRRFDTLDVWFDSGTAWTTLLPAVGKLHGKAMVTVVEGSDQFRGWFQSLLLTKLLSSDNHNHHTDGHLEAGRIAADAHVESRIDHVPVDGNVNNHLHANIDHGDGHAIDPPYSVLVKHGFVLDERGLKMSKSVGNVVDPEELVRTHGLDAVRVWAAACKSQYGDVSVGPGALGQAADRAHRFRSCLRFILGNTHDYACPSQADAALPPHSAAAHQMRPIDWAVMESAEAVKANVLKYYAAYEWSEAVTALYAFCQHSLSAFYFDVVKDRLYAGGGQSIARHSAQRALLHVGLVLAQLLEPMVPSLVQEFRRHSQGSHVVESPPSSASPTLETMRLFRERCQGRLQLSDLAPYDVHLSRDYLLREVGPLDAEDVAELLGCAHVYITICAPRSEFNDHLYERDHLKSRCNGGLSGGNDGGDRAMDKAERGDGAELLAQRSMGAKCPRCWAHRALVKASTDEANNAMSLCPRCQSVLSPSPLFAYSSSPIVHTLSICSQAIPLLPSTPTPISPASNPASFPNAGNS